VHAELASAIAAELRRPAPEPVTAFAAQLAARAKGACAAVLFYGSALRDGALDGVLDFYVLLDHERAWPGSRWAALANRVLPPNVGYVESQIDGRTLRAKYAVMSLERFATSMSPRSIDTTLWARFSQPCACLVARSSDEERRVAAAVQSALLTAARWAALLGPASGRAEDFWRALYARTYAAELRVERSTRGADLLANDHERYARLLPLAWREAGVTFTQTSDGTLHTALGEREREVARRRWQRRHRLGRPLNLLRLLKAASTFDNAIDYVAWKVERHSGYRIEPSAFQRRHPLLAAPALYWRLRARGVLR
jgi:hypothetical protein